ncbi:MULTISPECIES: TetR/AcrR family transcriptional regulator [Subtercola]|uniref:TetR/AcrR family transcriptional regulator n=1 Tax=Subtercola vilae TaxID=2056433 RepID=A0A4T2C644_9MICO|nr:MULTISPECIES: TetR/AcrR family transcriptional regulator [Subtercola]MEA9984053.1 TetR/AcrR family transcriptional regulator [Subtercola sp. RTI3]TIH38721.1 TetR/AcrR family transcriptional regulator [Subtercola vilae]
MNDFSASRAPRRDATENRQALLDSARLLLNRDPDTSLEAIAAGAGLSRRSIYGHFATRDKLIVALQASGSERVIAALAAVDHPDSRIAIALIGARLWSEVEHVRVMAQLAVRGPQRELFGETLAPLRAQLLAIVRRGVESGELRPDIEPGTLARLIEGAALSVLDEAVRHSLSRAEGHRLVMLAGLGAAGLSWREATAVVTDNPELRLIEEKTS